LAVPGLYLCLTVAAIFYATTHNSGAAFEWLFLWFLTLPWSGKSIGWPPLIGFVINLGSFFLLGFCLRKTMED
jgi:hypothetical protein